MSKHGDDSTQTSIELGDVAEQLSAKFPQIRRMYLFGSRAFSTGSARSDIDILLDVDRRIRPQDLRQFASGHYTALDLFQMEGGRATSTQNESFIEAKDSRALVDLLRAKEFWNQNSGRLGADISWQQPVRQDVTFVPTALPMKPSRKRGESIGL